MISPDLIRAPGGTRLITKTGNPVMHTAVRESDTRTALCRGVAEYMRTLVFDARAGREIKLKNVFQTWPSAETEATYPAALVSATSPGIYDASSFTPVVDPNQRVPLPDGRYVQKMAEFTLDVTVEIWATDNSERAEICSGLEQAFNPVDFMYGFILELPHYYNARAVFELRSMQYLDTEEDAMRRYRKAVFVLGGQVPLIRLVSVASVKKAAAVVEVSDSLAIVSVD